MAKKAIVMGATSGIGMEVAKLLATKGWQVGIAGRRIERLQALISQGGITCYQQIDVTSPDAPAQLLELIDKLGGMDLYFHSSGIGWQNNSLDIEKELKTLETNGLGFTRMVDTAFNWFAAQSSTPTNKSELSVSESKEEGKPCLSEFPHRLHHFHRRNQRSRCCPCLLCHQAIPESLSGMPVAAGTDASSPYRHHRYTTRFCKDRPYRRQQLSIAAQTGRCGKTYRECHRKRKGS